MILLTHNSYLHSLIQTVQELEADLEEHRQHPQTALTTPGSIDLNDSFLGTGTSADVFAELSRIPVFRKCSALTLGSSTDSLASPALILPALPTAEVDLARILTERVQHSLLEVYFGRVQVQHPPLFSAEQERKLLLEENPLHRANFSSSRWQRLILLAIFSVSATLVSRDEDHEYAYISHLCSDFLGRDIKTIDTSLWLEAEATLESVLFICLCATRELVCPNNGTAWACIADAANLLLNLRASYPHSEPLEEEIARYSRFLSQVEV